MYIHKYAVCIHKYAVCIHKYAVCIHKYAVCIQDTSYIIFNVWTNQREHMYGVTEISNQE